MPKQYLPEPVLEVVRSATVAPSWAEEVGRQLGALDKGQAEIANTARSGMEQKYRSLRNGQAAFCPLGGTADKPASKLSAGAFATMPRVSQGRRGNPGKRTPEQKARMAAAQQRRWARARGEQ